MKIIVDLTENEIKSIKSCIEVSESEGYEEDEAREALHKIEEAYQNRINDSPESPPALSLKS